MRFSRTLPVVLAAAGGMWIAADAVLAGPVGAVGDLYVTRYFGTQVVQYDGITGTFVGPFAGGPELNPGGQNGPDGLSFGPDGNLYVASFGNDAILKYDGNTGALMGTFAAGGPLDGPRGLTFGPSGNLFVATKFTAAVLEYDGSTGALVGTFVPPASGGLGAPTGLLFGPNGNLFVGSESGVNAVLEYDGSTGAPVRTFAAHADLDLPTRMVFAPDGRMFVTGYGSHNVVEFDQGGTHMRTLGTGQMSYPVGLALASNGDLLVAESHSGRVLEYDPVSGSLLGTFAQDPGGPSEGVSAWDLAFKPVPEPGTLGLLFLAACMLPHGRSWMHFNVW